MELPKPPVGPKGRNKRTNVRLEGSRRAQDKRYKTRARVHARREQYLTHHVVLHLEYLEIGCCLQQVGCKKEGSE